MASRLQFKKGEVLFHQDDPSDRVLRIRSGEVEVLREVGTAAVVLGSVRESEWLGEMAVIENRLHSATARAAADGVAEVFTAREFLNRLSSDPSRARDLILRLSIRLRSIEDKIAEDLLLPSFADGRRLDERGRTASGAVSGGTVTISLSARSDALRARIGGASIDITSLPFVVGRAPVAGEAAPRKRPDLVIEDEKPFRLSRDHFAITRSGDHLFLYDLGSTLGTIVNGQGIGECFMQDAAPLQLGENRVIAGGWGSPFEFTVTVG